MNRTFAALLTLSAAAAVVTACGSDPECVDVPAAVTGSIGDAMNDPTVRISDLSAVESKIGDHPALTVAASLRGGWADGEKAVWRIGWDGSSAGPAFSGNSFADDISEFPLQRGDLDEADAAQACLP